MIEDVTESVLPEGWSYDRLAEECHGVPPELLSLERTVVVQVVKSQHTLHEQWPAGIEYDLLSVSAVLRFGGYCLVHSIDDGLWYMGNYDERDGSVVCWGSYGPDLGAAIRGL